MPIQNGMAFLEDQVKKGCRCAHKALMSGAFTDETISKAKELGLKIFKKPFEITEIINWLDEIERDFDPQRELSDWFLNGKSQKSKE
jgi:hypothetical protein